MPVQPSGGSRPIPWSMVSLWSRMIGFLLLFVGTLIAIIGAAVWGGCVTVVNSCASGAASGILNYFTSARILWAIGLLGLGAGAGIKLHWGLQSSAQSRGEDLQALTAERRANYLTLFLTIVLFLILFVTATYMALPAGLP